MDNTVTPINQALVDSTTSTFPFIKLPPEIRNFVYGLTFVPSDSRALREIDDFSIGDSYRPKPTPRLADTALLRVCKTIYAEARPIFYAKNHFHYRVETHGLEMYYEIYTQNQKFLKRRFLKQSAEYVRHISFEVTVCHTASDPRVYRDEVERILPKYLRVIADSCRQLRYLEIHFVSAPPSESWTDKARSVLGSWQVAKKLSLGWQVDNIPLQTWEGATLSAINEIRAQTRLSRLTVSAIASDESENVFTGLCLPMAPRGQWTVSNHSRWVGFSQKLHSEIESYLLYLEDQKVHSHSVQQWCWGPKQQ